MYRIGFSTPTVSTDAEAAGGVKVHLLYREGECGSFMVACVPLKQTPPVFTLNTATGFLQFKKPGPFNWTEKTSQTVCAVQVQQL